METEKTNDSPAQQGAAKINIPDLAQAMTDDKEHLDFKGQSGVLVVNINTTDDGGKITVVSNSDFDSLPPEIATSLELALKLASNLIQSSLELSPSHFNRFIKRKLKNGIMSLMNDECDCEDCRKKEGGSHE